MIPHVKKPLEKQIVYEFDRVELAETNRDDGKRLNGGYTNDININCDLDIHL